MSSGSQSYQCLRAHGILSKNDDDGVKPLEFGVIADGDA